MSDSESEGSDASSAKASESSKASSHSSHKSSKSSTPSAARSESPSSDKSDESDTQKDDHTPTNKSQENSPRGDTELLDQQSVAPSTVTYAADNEVQQLKQSNEQLRKRLMQLNSQLDFELAQRTKGGVAKPGRVDEQKVAKLKARVEELRRENETLKRQVYRADGISKVTDLHNRVLQREQEIERLKEANRGLENVQRNQSKKMELVSQIESEKSRIRSAHNDELRMLKERLRSLKEAREQDEKTVKKLQGQINQVEDKINLARGLKSAPSIRTPQDVEKLIAEKTAKVNALTQTVEKLQKQIENERKRAGQRITEKDVEQLRATLQSLKTQVAEREKQVRRAERNAAPVTADTMDDDKHTTTSADLPSKAPICRPEEEEVVLKTAESGTLVDNEELGRADSGSHSDAGSGSSHKSASSDAKESDASSNHDAKDEDSGSEGRRNSSSSNSSNNNSEPTKSAASTPKAPAQAPPPSTIEPTPAAAPKPSPRQNPHNPFGFARKRRGS